MPTARQKTAEQFDVSAYMDTKKNDQGSINFFGVTVAAPIDTPLGATLKAQEAQRNGEEATRQGVLDLLNDVLGVDLVDEIRESEAGVRACGALLIWAYRNGAGEECTFPEAFDEYEENERNQRENSESSDGADEEGKPPAKSTANRETRRATGRATRSGSASGNTSR